MTLVRKLLADERVRKSEPSNEQLAIVEHIGEALDVSPAPAPRARKTPKTRKR